MGLPQIIGGNCEFCGIRAVTCQHAPEFRKAGQLVDEVSKALNEKLRAPIEGLPKVIGDHCEFCGCYFLKEPDADGKNGCIHLAARRKAILGSEDAKDETQVITKDTETLRAEAQAAKDAREGKVTSTTRSDLPPELGGDKKPEAPVEGGSESSGDAEMDKALDEQDGAGAAAEGAGASEGAAAE